MTFEREVLLRKPQDYDDLSRLKERIIVGKRISEMPHAALSTTPTQVSV